VTVWSQEQMFPGATKQEGPHEMWFSPWFLSVGYHNPGTGCVWVRDDDVVTLSCVDHGGPPTHRVWVLTDTFDDEGLRLGVWPD
jgi:hypothetical protein